MTFNRKTSIIFAFTLLGTMATALAAAPKLPAVQISAKFYRLAAAIDTDSVKAIGSSQTKKSPATLNVTMAEAARIEGIVTAAGGTLLGSPTVKTPMDQKASVSQKADDGSGYTLTVIPSSLGSTTITLNFKLSVSTVTGNRTTTRSASGISRVVEGKALLMITNPRDGQPGMLVVVTANRVKS